MRGSSIAWIEHGANDFVDVTGRWVEVEANVEFDVDGCPKDFEVISVFDLNKREEIGEAGITERELDNALERIAEMLQNGGTKA